MLGRGGRTLAAVLFTDIVASSAIAGDLGDLRWKELLARHHALVRRSLKRHGGRELDTAGDGFFASFSEPASAIRCACEASEAVRGLGIEIRAGVHFGECERVGRKLAGVAVAVGARVASLGGAGDVLVTSTAKDLVTGAGFGFADRGPKELKGVAGMWEVHAVTSLDGVPRPAPAAPAEALEIRRGIGPPRSPMKRLRAAVLIAGIALIALIGGVSLLMRGGAARPVALSPDSVARLDPATGRVVQAIRVGVDPRAILVTQPFVWVARTGSEIVVRIDPDTRATDAISASGHPTALTADDQDRVWVLSGLDGTLDRIHPTELRVELTIDDLPSQTGDVTFGSSALWVTDTIGRSLLRIDPVSGSKVAFDLGEFEPLGVAEGGGSVWVTSGSSLLRIDPLDGTLVEEITLRSAGGDIVVDPDSVVWVVHATTDQLTRVDAETGASSSIDVGNQPQSVAALGGEIWVADYLSGTLTRVGADGDIVRRVVLGRRPFAVGAGPTGVWATVL